MESWDNLAVVHPNAAGLDIGSREIWAAVRPDRDGETVRCFATFTPDLEALADWLLSHGVDTVAMESTGETGLKIIRAIVAGERDPLTLARLRHPSCHSSEETIAKALTGTWRDEQIFVLQQSLALYDFYSAQIELCNAEVERQFAAVKPRWDAPAGLPALPPVKAGSKTENKPADSTRQELFRITGVDLVAVDGISAGLALTIISEIGTDPIPLSARSTGARRPRSARCRPWSPPRTRSPARSTLC